MPSRQFRYFLDCDRRRRAGIRALALAGIAAISIAGVARGDTTATWTNLNSGDWATAANWSTNPNYPNNGTPSGTNYQVAVTLPSSTVYVAQISTHVVIDGLTVDSANAIVDEFPGAFLTLNNATIEAGELEDTAAELSGGVSGATITIDSGASFVLFGGRLDHLKFVGTDLAEGSTYQLTVSNGLDLSGHALNVSGSYMAKVFFDSTAQTIDNLTVDGTSAANAMYGPASLNIGDVEGSSCSLTLGANGVLDGSATIGQSAYGSKFINDGTVDANMSGQPFNIYFISNFTNNGALMATSGGHLNITSSGFTNNGSIEITGAGSTGMINNFVGTGTVTVGDGTNSDSLQVAKNSGLCRLSALTIDSGSYLDLTNSGMLISFGSNADPISTIQGYLKAGYNGGAWNGLGIDSSSAASDRHFALGYADGADGVVTGLSTGQIFVTYTLYGDANLDGVVNGEDFTILTSNLSKKVNGWDKGDFNYDGAVSGVDFTLLIGNLGKSASGASVELPAGVYAAVDAFAAANGLMADVPEPASSGAVCLIGFSALMRRRRQ